MLLFTLDIPRTISAKKVLRGSSGNVKAMQRSMDTLSSDITLTGRILPEQINVRNSSV